MTNEDWAKLIEQLGSIPGGSGRAIPDFFGHLVLDELAPHTSEWDFECWPLKDGGILSLRLDENLENMLRLFIVQGEDTLPIAQADNVFLDSAREGAVSPLLLLLLAIATGQVDDRKRLKQFAPGIDAAAKDLMLMSVCRLCG